MIRQQPVDAIRSSAFFIRSQRENQIAIGPIPFFLQPNEIRDQNRIALFNVFGSAAVKVAVFFDEFEGIHRPVFSPRLNNIEMADEQDGLQGARSVNPRDKVSLPRIWPEHHEVVA